MTTKLYNFGENPFCFFGCLGWVVIFPILGCVGLVVAGWSYFLCLRLLWVGVIFFSVSGGVRVFFFGFFFVGGG